MKLYTLTYKVFNQEEHLYYMPTKKDAIEYLKEQKERHAISPSTPVTGESGENAVTEVEIDSFEVKPTKKNLAHLLNMHVGTGW